MRRELLAPCAGRIADPLVDADAIDTARALSQAITFASVCRARHNALVTAVKAREAVTP